MEKSRRESLAIAIPRGAHAHEIYLNVTFTSKAFAGFLISVTQATLTAATSY